MEMTTVHYWEMIAGIVIGIIAFGTIIWRMGRMVEKNKDSIDKHTWEALEDQPLLIRHTEKLFQLEKNMDKLEARWLEGHAAVLMSNDKLRDLVTQIASNVAVVTQKVDEFIRTFERNKDNTQGGMR